MTEQSLMVYFDEILPDGVCARGAAWMVEQGFACDASGLRRLWETCPHAEWLGYLLWQAAKLDVGPTGDPDESYTFQPYERALYDACGTYRSGYPDDRITADRARELAPWSEVGLALCNTFRLRGTP